MQQRGRVWTERSSIVGAMLWMIGLSIVLTLLLGWIPFGPFLAAAIAGFIGGRKAGTLSRAALAAVLPAILVALIVWGIGLLAATLSGIWPVGAIATVLAGIAGFLVLADSIVLFLAALAGGWISESEARI